MKSIVLVSLIIVACSVFAAEPKEQVKTLKRGEIYRFEGVFSGNKVLTAEVECSGPGDVSKLTDGCGHSKHCTLMVLGETGQTAHMKFKCGQ